MNINEFAQMLDGREMDQELMPGEETKAELLGFVVIYGASDDLTEFRGEIHDEVGCYDGATILLDAEGIFEPCECKCKYFKEAKKKTRSIEAIWCGEEDYSWTYKTDIPHATFEILEDGERYCRGIVFDINSLK